MRKLVALRVNFRWKLLSSFNSFGREVNVLAFFSTRSPQCLPAGRSASTAPISSSFNSTSNNDRKLIIGNITYEDETDQNLFDEQGGLAVADFEKGADTRQEKFNALSICQWIGARDSKEGSTIYHKQPQAIHMVAAAATSAGPRREGIIYGFVCEEDNEEGGIKLKDTIRYVDGIGRQGRKGYSDAITFGVRMTENRLFGGFQSGEICEWDLDSPSEPNVVFPAVGKDDFAHPDMWVSCLSLSPQNGAYLAVGLTKTEDDNGEPLVPGPVRFPVFDVRKDNKKYMPLLLEELPHEDVNAVGWSPCGTYVWAAGNKNSTVLFDLRWPARRLCELRHHDDGVDKGTGVWAGVWTSTGLFLTGGHDGVVRVWDVQRNPDHQLVHVLQPANPEPIRSMVLTPEEDILAVGTDVGRIDLWSLHDDTKLKEMADKKWLDPAVGSACSPPSTFSTS
ncbi:hypothetical protein HK102_000325 [Quaeritorhiza haematococci]|nr:hypothetical protein HK102_000325 [Quaeritorhiza haematococci]